MLTGAIVRLLSVHPFQKFGEHSGEHLPNGVENSIEEPSDEQPLQCSVREVLATSLLLAGVALLKLSPRPFCFSIARGR